MLPERFDPCESCHTFECVIARDDGLRALQENHFDVAVIGGGVTGAGVAIDAASRGYTVALIERDDFSFGTSSRSSKMVHGGLRYLQNFDLGLVREALIERRIMVELAPHLVKPIPFLVAAFDNERVDRKVGLGLRMYDVMQIKRNAGRMSTRQLASRAGRPRRSVRPFLQQAAWSPERHRVISRQEVEQWAPALADRNPTSAYLFYDCQTDDSRLVLTILGEAERYGAVIANRVEAKGLIEVNGRAIGISCRDIDGDGDFDLKADNVVNATGVWADRIRTKELHDEAEVPQIRPSRGTHVTLRLEDLPLKGAIVVPAAGGRSIFALPWMGRTLVGTTDNDYEGEVRQIEASAVDIEYLLDAINSYFGTGFGAGDLTGAYAGVRPLISTGDPKKSVDISRKAELYETSSGMVTITGGKLTTWRAMAAMTVDRLVEREGLEAPCRTDEIPLGQPVDPVQIPEIEGFNSDTREHLAGRYGYAALELASIAQADSALAQQVVPDLPDVLAEIVIAARHEQAASLSDVLLRRTRLAMVAARDLVPANGRVPEPLKRVAGVLGDELGWDESQTTRQIDRWRDEAAKEGTLPA